MKIAAAAQWTIRIDLSCLIFLACGIITLSTRKEETIAQAGTLLLAIPNQLGVAYPRL
jgi:hypothetical protein